MATITLNYNTRNIQAQKALNYILSLGVFSTETVRQQRRIPAIGKSREYLSSRRSFDNVKTHLASEAVLANDWLNAQEDEVWKDL
jgi:hypothetical protein